ncbi:MAG: hypothetical protein PHG66_06260 [Candidatus Colwellbacteria bacterium]|nr:hypothetical protein [Candidatus Colwellbacteria bacterium]
MLPPIDGVIFLQTSPVGSHESLSVPMEIVSPEVEIECPSPSVTECRFCFQSKLGGCECSEYESSDSDCSEPNFHEEEEEDLPDPPSLRREDSYFSSSGPRFLPYTASIADSVMYREE